MADIRPFRALRFDSTKVKFEDVLTQPYDKITPAMQDGYYQRSPHNLVRYELGKTEPGDSDANNVYTRASAFIADEMRAGVLVREQAPCVYGYRQRFEHPLHKREWLTRAGFIALGRVHDYDDGVVFRHEQTLSKPKADRLNLLRTARTHSGQLFMLYEDPECAIDRLLERVFSTSAPDVELVDEYGVSNQLFRLQDEKIPALMAGKRLIIADGHHRYETALTYRNERRAAGEGSGPHDWAMMTFVNMSAPGLVILPTHRVVFGLDGWGAKHITEALGDFFSTESLPSREPASIQEALADAGRDQTAFAVVTHDAALLLRAHPERTAQVLSGYREMQRHLDVLVLHKVILECALGICEEAVREQHNVRYHRWAADAIKDVDSGANAAFLMNPVPVELLRDLTFAGTLMPQKSTDFYPKLLSGLTLYSLDESFAGASAFRAGHE
jgi:uncharacterized protein (DUF1015 family)